MVHYDLLDWLLWLAIQSTVLLSLGLAASWLLARRHAPTQGLILRATLLVLFLAPIFFATFAGRGRAVFCIPYPMAKNSSWISNPGSESVSNPEVTLPQQTGGSKLPALASPQDSSEDHSNQPDGSAAEPQLAKIPPQLAKIPEASEVSVGRGSWFFRRATSGNFLLVLWTLGCFAFLGRFLRAQYRLRQITRESTPALPHEIRLCQSLANDLGVACPLVRRSAWLASPCLAGIFRPTILLPETEIDHDNLRNILVHELAHQLRHDQVWNTLQQAAICCLFWQPLLWLLVRRLESSSEETCDNYVLQRSCHAGPYAKQLLAWANYQRDGRSPIALEFLGRSRLRHRLVALLDTQRRRPIHAGRSASVLTLATSILVIGMLGLTEFTSASPRTPAIAVQDEESARDAQEHSALHDDETAEVVGVIVDQSGKPLPGAIVNCWLVRELGDDLSERWLARLRDSKSYVDAGRVLQGENIQHSYPQTKVETDSRGQFRFDSLPANSLVIFQVSHPEITDHLFQVLNRETERINSDFKYPIYGNRPRIVTRPCRVVNGKLVDKQNGAPIQGFVVRGGSNMLTGVYGVGISPQTTTDIDGKFQLTGLPDSANNEIMFYPPKDGKHPWLIQEFNDFDQFDMGAEINLDIEIDRGVWLKGQVIDGESKQGIAADLRYYPVRNNPQFRETSGFLRGFSSDAFWFFDYYQTDRDGRFQIAVLPGKGVLGALTPGNRFRNAAGYDNLLASLGTEYSAQQIERYAQMGQDLRGKKFLDLASNPVLKNTTCSSYVPLDVPPAGQELPEPIVMDPGIDIAIKVQTSQANPIERFMISNHDGAYGQQEFADGQATLSRFGPNEQRSLHIQQIDGPLALKTTITPAFDGGTLQLQSRGAISGKLVDKSSSPLADYKIECSGGSCVTDEDGSFLIEELVVSNPALPIGLTIHRPESEKLKAIEKGMGAMRDVRLPQYQIRAGQTTDVGKVQVDPTSSDWWLVSGIGG